MALDASQCCPALAGNVGALNAYAHMERVVGYISTAWPFWNRTQGQDHMFWLTLDRGACHLEPSSAAEAAIKLVHFAYTYRGQEGPLGK